MSASAVLTNVSAVQPHVQIQLDRTTAPAIQVTTETVRHPVRKTASFVKYFHPHSLTALFHDLPTLKFKIQPTVLFSQLPISVADHLESKTFGSAGSKVHVRTL